MRSKVLVRIDRLLVKPVPVAVKMMPDGVYKGLAEVGTDGEYCGGLINLKLR